MSFIGYMLIFAVGSIAAAAIAKRVYPASSPEEALALLDGDSAPEGAEQ